LHNSKTNWDTYRQIIQDKVNLSIKLKEHEDIELETNNLLNLIQNAAKEATQNSDPQIPTNNTPYEIKKPVAEKGRARSVWQRTHTPDSRRKYNRISNKLKLKFQETRNESFEKYVSKLKREDNSVWKPIKIGENPKQHHPNTQIFSTSRTMGKKRQERSWNIRRTSFRSFSPHNNDYDQEVEQDLTTAIQSQERFKAFTLKEIKDEIKM